MVAQFRSRITNCRLPIADLGRSWSVNWQSAMFLILNQASFTLGPTDGASKDPEREGKQDDQKAE